jgi:hypothetical protein
MRATSAAGSRFSADRKAVFAASSQRQRAAKLLYEPNSERPRLTVRSVQESSRDRRYAGTVGIGQQESYYSAATFGCSCDAVPQNSRPTLRPHSSRRTDQMDGARSRTAGVQALPATGVILWDASPGTEFRIGSGSAVAVATADFCSSIWKRSSKAHEPPSGGPLGVGVS